MSAEWADLKSDLATRSIDAAPSRSSNRDRDSDAGAWPEGIETRFYAESSMTLPGMGDPGEHCGVWMPRRFCDDCGEPALEASRCELRTCPNCGNGSWRRRRSEKVTRRLGAARYAADDGLAKRAIHAVVSPPEGEIRTLVDVKQGRRDAYRLAEKKGIRGGVAIFHGFRVTDRAKELYAEAVEDGEWSEEEDGRLWAFVRQQETRVARRLIGENWRSLTYWSPHWHVLGLSRDFEADDPDDQDGWVARRVRSLSPFKLHDGEGYEDMVRTTMYLLSHATFETDSSADCLHWFGELATVNFSPESELSEGSLSVIERKAREAAAAPSARGETDDPDPCQRCGSISHSPIWEAGAALMDERWSRRIGRDQYRRLSAAFEWFIGEREPPPDVGGARTEDEAWRALEALL